MSIFGNGKNPYLTFHDDVTLDSYYTSRLHCFWITESFELKRIAASIVIEILQFENEINVAQNRGVGMGTDVSYKRPWNSILKIILLNTVSSLEMLLNKFTSESHAILSLYVPIFQYFSVDNYKYTVATHIPVMKTFRISTNVNIFPVCPICVCVNTQK